MPILGRTMVGIFPFFIGAVLLAISLFSGSYRFHDASYASINLYSMIAGDELQDVFRDLTSMNLLTAIVFLYIYVFFGIVAITNVFIAIAERGFSETKGRSRFDWVRRIKKGEGKDGEQKNNLDSSIISNAIKNNKSFLEDNNASGVFGRENSMSMTMNERSMRLSQ